MATARAAPPVVSSKIVRHGIFLTFLLAAPVAGLSKILCLHGGGQSSSSFEKQKSVAALQLELSSQFDFVYAQAPEAGDVWIRDAPGGKDAGTTDVNWAQSSVTYLDDLNATKGPFVGILAYSQGAAFAAYYVSQRQTSQSLPFQFAMLFCGYIPTVHSGLSNAIDAASPFHGIPALVFMGEKDWMITNAMTTALAGKYSNPTVISSPSEGHDLPASGSSELAQVVTWAGNFATGAATSTSLTMTTTTPTTTTTLASGGDVTAGSRAGVPAETTTTLLAGDNGEAAPASTSSGKTVTVTLLTVLCCHLAVLGCA